MSITVSMLQGMVVDLMEELVLTLAVVEGLAMVDLVEELVSTPAVVVEVSELVDSEVLALMLGVGL